MLVHARFPGNDILRFVPIRTSFLVSGCWCNFRKLAVVSFFTLIKGYWYVNLQFRVQPSVRSYIISICLSTYILHPIVDHGSVHRDPISVTCISYHGRVGREIPNSLLHDLTHIIADTSGKCPVASGISSPP